MIRVLFLIISIWALSGCASITTGVSQTVTVVTRHQGVSLNGANCELVNDKNKWTVVTPGSLNIQRSTQEMVVRCELAGYETGLSVLRPSAGMVWGNIIAGGLIGYAVDSGQGAGFDYPALITIDLTKIAGNAKPASAPVLPTKSELFLPVEFVVAQ